MCYACGAHNERGLHMEFRREGERAICDYTPCEYQQGYPGRMHGGIVATLLDEAMGWAVYGAQQWGATARLNVRFRRPVVPGDTLRIEMTLVRLRGRTCRMTGMATVDGARVAEATLTAVVVDRDPQEGS